MSLPGGRVKSLKHTVMADCSFFLQTDLQAVAGPLHRLWGWPDATAGGAGGPAPCSFPTYLPTLLQGPETLTARLQEEPGRD